MLKALLIDYEEVNNRRLIVYKRKKNWTKILNKHKIENIEVYPIDCNVSCHYWLESRLCESINIVLIHSNNWWSRGLDCIGLTDKVNVLTEKFSSSLFIIYSGSYEGIRDVPSLNREEKNVYVVKHPVPRECKKLISGDSDEANNEIENVGYMISCWLNG